jgi:hypothetical protein
MSESFWRPTLALACLVTIICALAGAPATGPTTGPVIIRRSSNTYVGLPTTLPSGVIERATLAVDAIPDNLRREYNINPFYKKHLVVLGIPIIGSEKVSDYAFLEAAWFLDHVLHGRQMALDALHAGKVRLGIIAVIEYTMDIPEYQRMGNGAYNDRRSRGLGGFPLATCAEENLLNLRGDPYGGGGRLDGGENITIHEFAHTLATAIRRVNRDWGTRLEAAYRQAMARGDYGNSYAATDWQEYWAEGTQCWFDCANPANSGGARTREQLKAKDPALAAILTEVWGDGEWRYTKTIDPRRKPEDLAHLAGLDRQAMPVFSFNNSPRIQAAATQPTTQQGARGNRGAGVAGGGTGARGGGRGGAGGTGGGN